MPPAWTPTSQLGWAVYEAGFTYDPSQDIIYSRMDALQRNFGYGFRYDEKSTLLGSVLDCEPIFFHYDNRYWMIELWKGQYGLETGCEIGVYTRSTPGSLIDLYLDHLVGRRNGDPVASHSLFYECAADADRLVLTAALRRGGAALFTRGPELHWWLTGFRWGICSDPAQLSVDVSVALKDAAMKDAFCQGISGRNYPNLVINANTVSFTFEHAFAVPRPVDEQELAKTQDDNRRLVDFYRLTPRPNNDPNQVEAEYLKYIGLGFLNNRSIWGSQLAERAVEIDRPADLASTGIVADLSSNFRVAPSTVERWLYNSQPITTLPDLSQAYLPMTIDVRRLDRAKPTDYHPTCITIDNTRGPSDLLLDAYTVTRGSYQVSPPARIPRGGVGRFVLAAADGPAAGTATYGYCDQSFTVHKVKFSCARGRRRFTGRASSSEPETWTCLESASDPTFPRDAGAVGAGSRYVRYVINEHRLVASTGKGSGGKITRLSGRPGTYWAPVEAKEAISQIETGQVTYFMRANGAEVLIKTVNGKHGTYLRKARATKSSQASPIR